MQMHQENLFFGVKSDERDKVRLVVRAWVRTLVF